MKLKLVGLTITFIFFYSISLSAFSSMIFIGALSGTNDGNTVITDTLNKREWLRWDKVNNLTYDSLLMELEVGGEYYGWQIAHNSDMVDLVNAIYDGKSHNCANVITHQSMDTCGEIDMIKFASLFGNTAGGQYELNMAFFLNDYHENGVPDVGLIQTEKSATDDDVKYGRPASGLEHLNKMNAWGSFDWADREVNYIGFQLYRNTNITAVPESTTLAIFTFGLFGLAFHRFKSKD